MPASVRQPGTFADSTRYFHGLNSDLGGSEGVCEGTGRSWEVSRGQGYTAAAWGRGAGWGTTLDVIDPSRWADVQANLTACARTVGISLSPKCRSQAACQKWGRQETSSQRPAWAALESAQAWSCLSPLGGQGRLQMEAGRGRGFSTGLAQAAQAFRGGRPAHTEKQGHPENS